MLSLADIMTPSPKSISLRESLLNARRMMNKLGIRHLPVTELGQLVGIISDRDIKLAESLYRGSAFKERLVKDVCIFEPYVVEEDSALDKVLMQMAKRRIGSALVTRKGKLVGILTTVDICRAFAQCLRR